MTAHADAHADRSVADRPYDRGVSARRSTRHRSVLAAASVAVAALALSGCGGDGEQAGSGGEQHGGGHSGGHSGGHGSSHDGGGKPAMGAGAADVAFAQGMIPHHRQALEMSGMAAKNAESAQVKALAERISKAQRPEIEKMSGWLKSWGEKVPAGGGAHSADSGHSMPGMMTPQDMGSMNKLKGGEFDREFLKAMTAHHEGAVEMARTEESKGSYKPAKGMAREIRSSQADEIKEMRGLLKK